MTALLIAALGLLLAQALYLASQAARRVRRAEDWLDAGGTLPGWVAMFGSAGVALAAFGLPGFLALSARYGLQAVHLALGLVLASLGAALIQKRAWLAARITRVASPVELLGGHYDSVGVRLFALAVVLLFAIPVAADNLAAAAALAQTVTHGAIPRAVAVWVGGFFLFLAPAIGGWRGAALLLAGQALLLLVLLALAGGLVLLIEPAPFGAGIAVPQGTFADQIPGVIQFSAGLGKAPITGGAWTTVALLSGALSLLGIALNPALLLLGNTTRPRAGFAFGQVWLLAGASAGLLLLAGPLLAAAIAREGAAGLAGLVERMAAQDAVAGVCVALLALVAQQIAVVVFVTAGASIVTQDVLLRFVLPDLSGFDRRLAGRVTLAVAFLLVASCAAFGPNLAWVLASAALSLSAQLLPALLGLCWAPWLTRAGVVTGLIFGFLAVLFTEPPGLLAFESLFLDLPWGRWPLTVHSAAWGLALNLLAALLVSAATQRHAAWGAGRDRRERLHAALRAQDAPRLGGPAARTAKWALALLWAYLGLGPGAILGNDFFSRPMFAGGDAALGVPSLWVWQMLFWLLGVLLVWWLAYPVRLGVIDAEPHAVVSLSPPADPRGRRRAPDWIALGLSRVAGRAR